ncbi:MAG: acetylglutamate kinase [Armatimonadetes bacterium]|nr:acetylglutamate kinase [Armatimonadota bacterium]
MAGFELAERAKVLLEALPYIREYYGRRVVVKYGGHAMVEEQLKETVMNNLVLMHYVGMEPVLVHGGGPEITDIMKRVGKKAEFVNGLRVTDRETMELVEMALTGKTNKSIVSLINRQGGRSVGLSGKDADLIVARKMEPGGADIGFVGEVEAINTEIIDILVREAYIPVISSVGVGADGNTYNINADYAAGEIAAALTATKLIMMTDVTGVLADKNDPVSLIPELSADQAREMIASGQIDKGMIPKVEACIRALEGGVERTHIIDGRIPNALLMEVFTNEGIGTMIVP